MIASDREWHRVAGAPLEEVSKLRSAAPASLPDSYFDLLAWSNGGEGPLGKQPLYFQLDPVDVAIGTFSRGLDDEFFSGFLMIGSNGGGEYIAFDVRGSAPWPIVSLDMTNTNLAESVQPVAEDFDTFLSLVGIDSDN